MTDIIAILGAPDPEMQAIRSLLEEAGIATVQATADGRPVHPGSAYRADPVTVPDGSTVWRIECELAIHGAGEVVVIDHHRPDDPGYGRPPGRYWTASSLGQVLDRIADAGLLKRCGWLREPRVSWSHDTRPPVRWQYLRRERVIRRGEDGACPLVSDEYIPTGSYVVSVRQDTPGRAWTESPDGRRPAGYSLGSRTAEYVRLAPPDTWGTLLLVAAADHCLGAAYRGECPGVDPDELMQWRAETRAAHQGRSVYDVLADVEAAQEALRRAKPLQLVEAGRALDDPWVFDLRRDEPIPELPEAAMRMGLPYVAGPIIGPDGRRKITCSGRAEHIRAFLDDWAPRQGLIDTYGDPERGFAGGYLPDC